VFINIYAYDNRMVQITNARKLIHMSVREGAGMLAEIVVSVDMHVLNFGLISRVLRVGLALCGHDSRIP